MRIAVLGPLEVDEGRILLAPRDQVVLEALAARPGETVRAEALAEALWGERLPQSWTKVVQGCISRLRKTLGAAAIVTSGNGYRLALHRDEVDQMCFEDLLLHAGELLANGEPERARFASGQALRLWRGDPLGRLTDWPAGRVEAERLAERRLDAEDLYVDSAIRAGRHGDVLGDLRRMVAQQPTRERRWGLLAWAQYQGGRQAEALGTLQRARATLVDEFGLDPGPQLADLEEAILRQDPSLSVPPALSEHSTVCPYPGLVAYEISDAGSFFGREDDLESCLSHLDVAGTLAIVGASGSGKSSLARAGVAAALTRDGRRVRVVAPGRHPLDVMAGTTHRTGEVLIIDQCEEALAPEVDGDERTAFFAALNDVVATKGLLVLTLRADRLGEVSRYATFAHLVERGLYLLGPMDTDALRRAIEGPAAQAGLRLEPGLVDLLVREVEGAPGALPMLSHVLRQTWIRREGNTLTVAGYTATGGVQGAVSQSAEAVFREMTLRQQDMLRNLMLRLVVPSDSGDPVRTRAPRRSVAPDEEHNAVIEDLVGARLLSSDGDTVEIAHEALALAWPRLRSWLDDDVEGLRIMRHLAVAAHSWEELGRPPSELYRGPRQAKAEQWRTRGTSSLTPVERDFLDASAALAEADARATEQQVRLERRSNRRLRVGLAAVAAVLAVALAAGVVAVSSAQRARQQARVADARRLGSEALRSEEIDRSLLLAVAGRQLDDTADTRSNLNAVLGRTPQLLDSTRSSVPISISISPDGRTLATGGALTGVRLLDAATLEETATNYSVPVRKVLFSPDGAKLFAAVNPFSPNGMRRVDPIPLRVLDPVTAQLAGTQLGGMPPGLVLHEAYSLSTDGRWLAAAFLQPKYADNASHVRVWDMRDMAAPVASFTVPYLTDQLAISPDGHRVFVTGEDAVHLLDVAGRRELNEVPVSDVELLALTPDARYVAVARGQDVALLDPKSLSVMRVLPNESAVGGDFAIAAKGDTIAYAVGNTLHVRSLTEPDAVGTSFSTGSAALPTGIAFAKDMRTVYATMEDNLTLAWDAAGDRQLLRPLALPPRPDPAQVFWVRISPDGRTAAYLLTDGKDSFAVQFLDVVSKTWTRRSPFTHSAGFIADVAWDRGSRKFATALGDQSVRVWDPRTAHLEAEYPVPADHGITTTVGFSGDGMHVVVGTDEGWLHTAASASGRAEGRPVHIGPRLPPDQGIPVYSIDVDINGTTALVSVGGILHVADLAAGAVRNNRDLGFQVESYARSPVDGNITVGGSALDRKRLATLDPATLEVRSRPTDADAAGQLRFSRDGTKLLAADATAIRLSAADNGQELGSLRLGDGGIGGAFFATAAFNADQSRLLIATDDGTMYLWDPSPTAAEQAACRMAGRDLTTQEWATYLPGRQPYAICPPKPTDATP